ncbi:unnamed protein product [Ectocarpus sp. CCAP 1310/34]|nr:unnamed protein product [Ectocarpus sp. CCAP 1310/34]
MGCCASLLKCCVRAETENPLLDGRYLGGVGDEPQQVDLNLDFEELRDVQYLTNGGMCSIYTAEWRGRRVVVKMPRDDCAQPEVARKDLETEIDILQRLQHPNIVEMLGAGFVNPLDVGPDGGGGERGEFRDLDQANAESKRFVLLEYLVGGTLTESMLTRNPPADGMMSSVVRRWQQNWQFPTKKAIDSALQLASALSYLHGRAIEGSFVVHRDLKPENIAFSGDGRLKLFDFGLAKIVRRRGGRLSQRYEMTGETGSTRYMCPEVAMQLPYNEKADVYSFGLILWEMLSLRRPFEGLNRKEFVQSVIKGGRRPPLQQEWSAALRELMRRCWDEDMDTRPEFEEVEDTLLQITHREATWGGMLSGATPSTAAPSSFSSASAANGINNGGSGNGGGAGSLNGRTGGPKAGREGGEGLIVGVGSSNGGGGDILPETRTLV